MILNRPEIIIKSYLHHKKPHVISSQEHISIFPRVFYAQDQLQLIILRVYFNILYAFFFYQLQNLSAGLSAYFQ